MFLSEIHIRNFRCFDDNEHIIKFDPGLNVIVGENDSGKSAVIDAIRIALGTTDQSWYKMDTTDFYNEDKSREITIICRFDDLTLEERAAFLECLTYEKEIDKSEPCLYLYWNCKYLLNFTPARISVSITTGLYGEGPQPSAEARELIRVTYLRALRDAYSDMQSGRNSRLSQIIQRVPDLSNGKSEYEEGMKLSELSIAGIADLSNKLLLGHTAIKQINKEITDILTKCMLLHGDNIKTQLQVADLDISENKRIISLLEKLDLIPITDQNQSQGRVGLGTSNILSMACELLLNDLNKKSKRSSFLLIEEPEAHLHAQRQLRLIQSLQEEASIGSCQIIITTHSPLLASVVDLNHVILMYKATPFSLSKEYTMLDENDYYYLNRYLDATKANLFFARGVLIVEGPSEELLLPTIAKIIKREFTSYGVSIVNVRGIGLRRFARIFQRKDEKGIPIPVACITDRDILPDCAPAICFDPNYTSIDKYPPKRKWITESELSSIEKEEHVRKLMEKADGQYVKTFISDHWTLEYDMFYSGLNDEMLQALVELLENNKEKQDKKLTKIKKEIISYPTLEHKSSYFYSFFYNNNVSKAEFAQKLASIIYKKIVVNLSYFCLNYLHT